MLTVTASLWFVTNCAECCTEVEKVTRAAIRDAQVTKLTISAGHKHCHPVEESKGKDLAQPPSAAALEAAGQQTLPGTLDGSLPYVEGQ
ncbi:hypothetical protein [Edaphobacter flagellatus]|uniref:hypothetical protein n=1 Tax=Edaphobacter flagellatus TaxID=1933044 RepID=UPI0021B19E5E|nr:hypothetical protein [Edaphobacter flagellatus]